MLDLIAVIEKYQCNFAPVYQNQKNSKDFISNKIDTILSSNNTITNVTKDIFINNKFHVFPNPTEAIINISTISIDKLNYKIYSSSSELIKSGIVTENSINIELLNTGVYILELEEITTQLKHNFKIIKI